MRLGLWFFLKAPRGAYATPSIFRRTDDWLFYRFGEQLDLAAPLKNDNKCSGMGVHYLADAPQVNLV